MADLPVPGPVCSALSLARAEPLQATASMVRSWVLIEQPGAWGPDAVTESGLPAGVAGRLAALARAHGFRVLLLRRPTRSEDGSRQCFVAYSGRGDRWIEERRVADVEELLDVDFSPLRHGAHVGFGHPRSAPLYLVCTNGRHDPCCANLGRPVARALQRGGAAGSVWECSHFGGDRFAGNLVCLPDGLYFGRLGPDDAERVVRAYEHGIIDLAHYRGRAGEPFAAQAAEFFIRSEDGLTGLDDLSWTSHRHGSGNVVEVSFVRADGGTYDVRVGIEPSADPRPLSCHGQHDGRPPTYSLLEMNRG